MKTKKGDGHGYLLMAVVIISWGIVPAFAKMGDLSGDLTTMYVNLVATITIALLITLQGKWKFFRKLRLQDYAVMVGIGLVWPLIYSVTYFESVKQNGAALTTILNYTWPVFTILFGYLINRRKTSWFGVLGVGVAVIAVAVTNLMNSNIRLDMLPLVMIGLIAAVSQGFYTSATDKWRYDPWVMTLIVEIVTTVGVIILVFARESLVVPSLTAIGYLAVIGVISNGVGFWAFLAGSQNSGRLGSKNKNTWLIGMCFIPFAQVVLLPILGIENIDFWKWLGVGLVTVGLIISKFDRRQFVRPN